MSESLFFASKSFNVVLYLTSSSLSSSCKAEICFSVVNTSFLFSLISFSSCFWLPSLSPSKPFSCSTIVVSLTVNMLRRSLTFWFRSSPKCSKLKSFEMLFLRSDGVSNKNLSNSFCGSAMHFKNSFLFMPSIFSISKLTFSLESPKIMFLVLLTSSAPLVNPLGLSLNVLVTSNKFVSSRSNSNSNFMNASFRLTLIMFDKLSLSLVP